jgi:hypothetical protein
LPAAAGGTVVALAVVGAVLVAGGTVGVRLGDLGAPGWTGRAPGVGAGPGVLTPRPPPPLTESTPAVATRTSANATTPILTALGNPRSLPTTRFNSALSTALSPVP